MDVSNVEKGYADVLVSYRDDRDLYRISIHQNPWGCVTASRWMPRSDTSDMLVELGCSYANEMCDAAIIDTGPWQDSEAIETVVF